MPVTTAVVCSSLSLLTLTPLGMYFTSSALYALPYYGLKRSPAILVCLGAPGNAYPVVEGMKEKDTFMGSPIKSGYQSHYVLTQVDGHPIPTVPTADIPCYDEVVLAQESQVVPVYVVELHSKPLDPLFAKYQREIVNVDDKTKAKTNGSTAPSLDREPAPSSRLNLDAEESGSVDNSSEDVSNPDEVSVSMTNSDSDSAALPAVEPNADTEGTS